VPSQALFIPFFIVPTLDWLFWNWLKAFVQCVHAGDHQCLHPGLRTHRPVSAGPPPPGLRLEEQLYGVHAVMIC
jgi:hypothetical protein